MVILTVCAHAWGQEGAGHSLDKVDQERQRIDGIRQQQNALFNEQEAACQARFAVTDCVNSVRARRRAMLVDLKRQETVLNSLQRSQRGEDQLRISQEKAVDQAKVRAQAEADALQPPQANAQADKKRALDEKVMNHPKPLPSPAAPARSREKPAAVDASVAEANRKDYEAKQKAAAERRADKEKRLKDSNGRNQPLPVPP
jgi:colicin import membrane protein